VDLKLPQRRSDFDIPLSFVDQSSSTFQLVVASVIGYQKAFQFSTEAETILTITLALSISAISRTPTANLQSLLLRQIQKEKLARPSRNVLESMAKSASLS
jgi:hypothetical protein